MKKIAKFASAGFKWFWRLGKFLKKILKYLFCESKVKSGRRFGLGPIYTDKSCGSLGLFSGTPGLISFDRFWTWAYADCVS